VGSPNAPDALTAIAVLEKCPKYRATPLQRVDLGEGMIWVKDETDRFGLGSFKALGGLYAVVQLVLDAVSSQGPLYGEHNTPGAALRDGAAGMVFVCGSAGNHGLAVAAGAKHCGARARVHLPASAPPSFAARLKGLGAEVYRSATDYEDALDAARRDANACGGILVSDCEDDRASCLVMEGYSVLAEELRGALEQTGIWPTHIFLQAGVGGLAAAVAMHIRRVWARQPEIVVVEPVHAACLAASLNAARPVRVAGPPSNMQRLDCKTPSVQALRILRAAGVSCVTVTDEAAADAVAILRRFGMNTTPSGAAGFAALQAFKRVENGALRPLVILTEGLQAQEDANHA
jgi:diaminopropionate ammonia-lyase